MPVIATGLCNLIIYLVTGCFIMNDSDESDDDFFDAMERQDNTQQRSIEQRVDRLEKQMEVLSGQMSTIMEKLEDISLTLESSSGSVPDEKARRYKPMRACHARKKDGTGKKDVPTAGQPPPPHMAEPEIVDLYDDTEELAEVLKDFPTIPVTDPKSRRGKPHVPPITIPVYNGVGHVDDWI